MRLKTKKMAKRFKVTEDYDVVLANCSGGKDSTVSAFLASLHVPPEKLYILHMSSSWNFPGTREQVENMCKRWGVNLIVVTPCEDVEVLLVKYGPPRPLPRMRWCRRVLKTDPVRRKVYPMFEGKRIVHVDGSRREESRSRAEITLLETKEKARAFRARDVLRPIYDWTEKRVWNVMRAYELPIHPVYRWSTRLSCYCCPLQSRGSWLSLKRFHPDLFEKAVELEALAGESWLMGYQWLRDLESEERSEGLKEPMIIARRRRVPFEVLEVEP